MPQNSSRRDFLKQMSFGAAAALSFPPLERIHRRFARTLASLAAEGIDFAGLRAQYTLAPELIYFNHAAIGTIPRPVQEAHWAYLQTCEQNPWLYMWGGAWESSREAVRGKAAAYLHCAPEEIAITHNTTEAFNLLAHGLPLGRGDEVLFSSLNHAGASICWQRFAADRGFQVKTFDFPLDKIPDITAEQVVAIYAEQITPATRVLVFPHVDNMVGLRHPMEALAKSAHEQGVEFVAVDGAQTAGMLPLALEESGVDFYATSPHKWLQAPKGLGILYVRKAAQAALAPMWVTWGQNRWQGSARQFEDYGTRNLPALLALGDAIDFQSKLEWGAREARLQALWRAVRDQVDRRPRARWHSPGDWGLGASLIAVEFAGRPCTAIAEKLFKEHGIVLRPFAAPELNTLRISPNVFNTPDEVERFFGLIDAHFG